MSLWLEMADSAPRILEKLQKHSFSAIRCIADGRIVVSVYLVSTEQHIKEAASTAERYYANTQRLEVQGVSSSPQGAVVRSIVTFSAQPMPSSSDCQQEGAMV